MTKGTKIYFFVVLGIILLCFAAGCFVRISFTGYGTFEEMEQAESLEDFRIQLRGSEEGSFSDSVEDYNSLAGKADFIAKVSATKDRVLSIYAVTKTKVVVREVYKGGIKPGQEIFIYEPAGFSYAVSKYYDTQEGYQLMKEGEEYYVFLKKLKTAAGYRLPDREKNAFLPVAALYSKFPVKPGKLGLTDGGRLEEGEYSYGETKDLEIITSEQEVLSKYRKIKKEVLKMK